MKLFLKRDLGRRTKSRGVATLELALLTPVLVLFSLGLVQLIIYLQSSTVTEYAAFAAARAFQVYGDRRLHEIDYPHVRELPFTNQDQTISEAAAEKVIFESLLWEHPNVVVDGGRFSLKRYYEDGIHHFYDDIGSSTSEGAIHVNFIGCKGGHGCPDGSGGVEVIYCLPMVFPGVDVLFSSVKKKWPCKVTSFGKEYSGVAISKAESLGRMTMEP